MAAAASDSNDETAAPRGSRFVRWLHRSYRAGAGANHYLVQRVCPAGLALGAVLVVAGTLAMGQPRESVFGLCSLAGTLFLIAWLGMAARGAKVSAAREVPRHGTVGMPVAYTVRVRNIGRGKLARAWLRELQEDPRPPLWEFVSRPEPGERRRNRFDRTFIYYRWQWLMARRSWFSGGDGSAEIRLPNGAETDITVTLTPLRRGVIRLHDLRILLPDPLGLFQRCRKVPAPAATLTVLPRRYPLPPLEMPGTARFQIGGESTGNSIGNDGEFVGLRDYRRGDPPRQIHWRSWARTGRPIVKELEDTHYPRYGLVVDTFAAGEGAEVFEDVVSVAASFAATIDTHESLLDVMFIKDRAHVITAGRGLARADRLLEALAAVEPEPGADFDRLHRLVLRYRDELTSCLVVLAGWDDLRRGFLRRLAESGIRGIPLVVGRGEPPPGVVGYWLESGELARDLRRLPTRLMPI